MHASHRSRGFGGPIPESDLAATVVSRAPSSGVVPQVQLRPGEEHEGTLVLTRSRGFTQPLPPSLLPAPAFHRTAVATAPNLAPLAFAQTLAIAIPVSPIVPPPRPSTPHGLPSVFALFLGIAAVAAALACDFVFLHVRVPVVGPYAWYLTTALAFFSAGHGTGSMTRAGRGLAGTAIVLAAVLYGAADVALARFVESLSLHAALVLAAEGVAIALVTGWRGAHRGFRVRSA